MTLTAMRAWPVLEARPILTAVSSRISTIFLATSSASKTCLAQQAAAVVVAAVADACSAAPIFVTTCRWRLKKPRPASPQKYAVPRQEYCETCNGTGAKKGTGVTACQTCAGRGQIVYQQGFFTINRTCPACQGAGQIVKERCADCRGQGRVERERSIDLRIPPGVDTGTRLRISGEGEPGPNGGPAGDLYVVLDVKEHNFFERRGADLYCTIPISIAQATLGAELQVPGLSSEERLKIPEGTQSGAVFRIKGKGLPDPHGGGRGDLYYLVRVITPSKLTKEQRK